MNGENQPRPMINLQAISSDNNLQKLLQEVKKLQKINFEGGLNSAREPLTARNAVFEKKQQT